MPIVDAAGRPGGRDSTGTRDDGWGGAGRMARGGRGRAPAMPRSACSTDADLMDDGGGDGGGDGVGGRDDDLEDDPDDALDDDRDVDLDDDGDADSDARGGDGGGGGIDVDMAVGSRRLGLIDS
jgi:hypothetical protein